MVRLPVLGGLVGGPVTGGVVGGPVEGLTGGLGGELSGLSGVGGIPLGGDGTLNGTLNSGVSGDKGSGLLGVVGLDLIGVSVEEEIGENRPVASVDGASKTEDLSAEQVPDETDRVTRLVVARDGNVNKLQRGVSVTEGNDGDVDVSGLPDGLVVNSGVGDDDQSGLLERSGDVVGERTGGESSSNGLSTGESGVLQDGSVTVRSGTDDANIVGVLDGSEDSSSEDDLGVGLADVNDVDTVTSLLVDVRLHLNIDILRSNMRLRREQEGRILRSERENVCELVVGHLEELAGKRDSFAPPCTLR